MVIGPCVWWYNTFMAECPFCFTPGVCSVSKEITAQATDGNLTKGMWKGYLARIKRDVVPVCLHKEELLRAVSEAKRIRKATS